MQYVDSKYNYLRKPLSSNYYRGEFKIGLNLYSFNRPLRKAMKQGGWGTTTHEAITTFDAIKWAKEAGFDSVDTTFYFVPGYDDFAVPTEEDKAVIKKNMLELKEFCAQIGMEIYSTGIKNDFCTSDAARLKRDVERACFYAEMSELLDAEMMRVFAGPIPDDIDEMGFERVAEERLVRCLAEIADHCIEKGIKCKVAPQNHGDFLSTANQVLYVMDKLKDYENIGLINDSGHFRPFGSKTAENYPWYDDIARCLPVSIGFQLKTKPAGTDSKGPLMDLPLFFRHLRSSEYRGQLPIEVLWTDADDNLPEKFENPVKEFKSQMAEFLRKVRAAELASRDMEPICWEGGHC